MAEENQLINDLFAKLDKWRLFPSYQLERRSDIFFAVYLPDIIKKVLKYEVTCIIPEFPIRIGGLNNKELNRSFKIDYLVYCKKANRVLFIELKTDITSRKPKQDKYLEKAKEINIKQLIEGFIKISKATKSTKYFNLIQELVGINWIKMERNAPENSSIDYEIEIVYIQPKEEISPGKTIISFDDIIDTLSSYEDIITKRFVESLRNWRTNPN